MTSDCGCMTQPFWPVCGQNKCPCAQVCLNSCTRTPLKYISVSHGKSASMSSTEVSFRTQHICWQHSDEVWAHSQHNHLLGKVLLKFMQSPNSCTFLYVSAAGRGQKLEAATTSLHWHRPPHLPFRTLLSASASSSTPRSAPRKESTGPSRSGPGLLWDKVPAARLLSMKCKAWSKNCADAGSEPLRAWSTLLVSLHVHNLGRGMCEPDHERNLRGLREVKSRAV